MGELDLEHIASAAPAPLDPRWPQLARLVGADPEALADFHANRARYIAANPRQFANWPDDPAEVTLWEFLALWLGARGNAVSIDGHTGVEDFLFGLGDIPTVAQAKVDMAVARDLLPDGLAALTKAEVLLEERGLAFIGTFPGGDGCSFAVIPLAAWRPVYELLKDLGEDPSEMYDPDLLVELWPGLAHEEP